MQEEVWGDNEKNVTAVQFMASLKILYDGCGRAQGDASHASGHASERCEISVLLESMDSCWHFLSKNLNNTYSLQHIWLFVINIQPS